MADELVFKDLFKKGANVYGRSILSSIMPQEDILLGHN